MTARAGRSASVAAVATACVAFLLMLAPPARAQTPPGTEGQFTYHPTEGARGDSIFFDAKCLWGGSGQGVEIDVVVGQTSVGGSEFSRTYAVAMDGTISDSLAIPTDAQSGAYQVAASCRLDDQVFFTSQPGPFTVTGPPLESSTTSLPETTSPPPSVDANANHKLARTGMDIRPLVVASAGLAVTGLVLTSQMRRRRDP